MQEIHQNINIKPTSFFDPKARHLEKYNNNALWS